MQYDFAIDMWSIGCTLFELYTGKILFTGSTNNQMLRSIMECRGKFSLKMLKKAEFAIQHFDDSLMFRSVEKDKITGKVRLLANLPSKPGLTSGTCIGCRPYGQLSQANQGPKIALAWCREGLERRGNERTEPVCGFTRSMLTPQPGQTVHTYGRPQSSFHQQEEALSVALHVNSYPCLTV